LTVDLSFGGVSIVPYGVPIYQGAVCDDILLRSESEPRTIAPEPVVDAVLSYLKPGVAEGRYSVYPMNSDDGSNPTSAGTE
jgi:hypothetical protein